MTTEETDFLIKEIDEMNREAAIDNFIIAESIEKPLICQAIIDRVQHRRDRRKQIMDLLGISDSKQLKREE